MNSVFGYVTFSFEDQFAIQVDSCILVMVKADSQGFGDGGQTEVFPKPNIRGMPFGVHLGSGGSLSPESALARIPFGMIKAHLEPIVRWFFKGIVPSRTIRSCIGNQDNGLASDFG